jgi:hypothetical protein
MKVEVFAKVEKCQGPKIKRLDYRTKELVIIEEIFLVRAVHVKFPQLILAPS